MSAGLGELFVLGFRGLAVPEWLARFAARHGLGGAILFDRDVPRGGGERNVRSPEQVRELCAELHALPTRPLVMVDQEGGRVRRLKEERGFAPLPSARAFAALPLDEARDLARRSLAELGDLGIDYDLAPVIDLDTNPANPNIGALERSWSADPAVVRRCARVWGEAARGAGVGLCVKHYPGLGGAATDSHTAVTDVSDTLSEEQLDLFGELALELPGRAVLLSHALVRDWDARLPCSVSPRAVNELRRRVGDALLVTDDLQMEGLRAILPLPRACEQAVRAGVDLLVVGNNLLDEEADCVAAVESLESAAARDSELRVRADAALARVQRSKAELQRWRE